MNNRLMNSRWQCRFPNCWADVDSKVFFCGEHEEYRDLERDLFSYSTNSKGETEPLTGVYVVGSTKVGAIKIGIASDVMSRLSQIQTGFPFRLAVYGALFTQRRVAAQIERAAHDKLKEFGFHLNGEWFDVDPDDAIRLVKKVAGDIGAATLTTGQYHSMVALWDDIHHGSALAPLRKRILEDAILSRG